MKTSELQGALLDFWTARAEGVPADQLEIRADAICVLLPPTNGLAFRPGRVDPSTNWALAGPLVEKHHMDLLDEWNMGLPHGWKAETVHGHAYGHTAMIAICRAVVRAAFGDEVEAFEAYITHGPQQVAKETRLTVHPGRPTSNTVEAFEALFNPKGPK